MKPLPFVLAALAMIAGAADAAPPCRDLKTAHNPKCGDPAAGGHTVFVKGSAGGQVSPPDKTGHCYVVVPIPGTNQKVGQFARCQ